MSGFWLTGFYGDDDPPFEVISRVSDFPAPDVDGVIYLSKPVYLIAGEIDLGDLRLHADSVIVIKGNSSEASKLIRTASDGQALLTARDTCILRDLSISAPLALDLDASGPIS